MKSQHWFRQWLGAVMLQAITLASVDLCRRMASLYHNGESWISGGLKSICDVDLLTVM